MAVALGVTQPSIVGKLSKMAELTFFIKNRLDSGIPHTDIAEQTPMQRKGGRRWPVGIWQFYSQEQPRTACYTGWNWLDTNYQKR